MRRKFLINIVFLLAVSILVKAFWVLGIDRTVQNVVGEAAYGSYFSLFSFSVLFTLLLDMGLSGFNNRAVSADPSRVKLYFGNVLLLRLLLTAAYILVTLTVALALGYERWQILLLLVLMGNQVMASMILWLRSNISGLQFLFLDSLLSVADRLVMIIICSFLLWGGLTEGRFSIEWFIWSQSAAYLIVMCLTLVIVIRKGGVSQVRPDARVLRSIIMTGLPYAAVVFAMTVYWRIDSVMIERLLPDGAREAGIYAQAFRLFDALAMIPVMFGGLLLPIMSRGLSSGNDIRPLVSMAWRMLLAPLGLGAVTLATFPEEILDLLYTSPAGNALNAFSILMLTLVPVGLIYIYSTVLTAAGRFKLLGVIMVSGMVLNITINRLTIPSYGAPGAAFTALVSQSAVALACMIAVGKSMFRVVSTNRLWLYILMLLITCAAGRLMRLTGINWVIAASAQLAAGFIVALAFRMIEPFKSLKLIMERPDSI
ncbi:MAG: polysaccharide biosynthesis C-terminal domain-containing protein [Bacteroidales bacterium]|nr:polysaccharide biosynthesis C-terminal domain-containing protein [Bacteroidales bacterium]